MDFFPSQSNSVVLFWLIYMKFFSMSRNILNSINTDLLEFSTFQTNILDYLPFRLLNGPFLTTNLKCRKLRRFYQ